MANKLKLILNQITDVNVRENFKRLVDYFDSSQILEPDWQFYEIEVKSGENRISHNLRYRPKDIIILSVEGDRNYYFQHEKFNKSSLYVYSEGDTRIRFLAGNYGKKGYTRAFRNMVTVPPPSGGSGGGSTWLNGTGTPLAGLGADGNYYLNLNNGDVWYKSGGAWTNYTVHPTVNSVDKLSISRLATEELFIGDVVKADSSTHVSAATNNLTVTDADAIGVATNNAPIGGIVNVLIFGVISDPSFFGFTVNDRLYLDLDGAITNVKPPAPDIKLIVGKSLGGNDIFVKIESPTIQTA